jgi:parallel beta-helix repeat protein
MVYNQKTITLSTLLIFLVFFVIFFLLTACEGMYPKPEPVKYVITASAGNHGTIEPEGEIVVNEGQDKAFEFSPDTGYQVDDVLINNESVGAVETYTFTHIEQDCTIEVTFEKKYSAPSAPSAPIYYTISTFSGLGGSIEPGGDITVLQGEDQSLNIIPGVGFIISDVLIDNVSVGVTPEYTFENIVQDHTISASFTREQFIITSSASDGGTISPLGETVADWGENKCFVITANDGYLISELMIDNTLLENFNPTKTYNYTFNDIRANHTIEVSFIQKFTITASAGNNGSIKPEGDFTVIRGESKNFSIIPDICYQIEKIIVNGVEVTPIESSYNIIDVKDDYKIEVSFTFSDKKIRRYNKDGELQYDDYSKIQEAIYDDNTSEGDIIIVCPGTYNENLIFKGSKKITVQSVDPENKGIVSDTIIDGGSGGSVAHFSYGDESTLQGFTITKGSGTANVNRTSSSGGGIYINSSSPNISYNIIENNGSDNGGGIYIAGGSSPEIEKNTIRNNSSTNMAGGIYIKNSSPKVFNNIICDNVSDLYGGGVYIEKGYIGSNNSISNNIIQNNQISHDGGGIYLTNTSPNLLNNSIENNNANNYGGGIYIESCSPNINENNFICGNIAANGGGICIKNAYIDSEKCITGNTIVNNTASSSGGGFYIDKSSPLIFDNIIGTSQNNQGNSARWGGGIYMVNCSDCKVEENVISGNLANIGGGFYLNTSFPIIKENTISYNIINDTLAASGGIM